MIAEVANKREEIAVLCRQFGVRRLELFGSAARGDFDPATSDVDFILEMDDAPANFTGRYFRFIEAMEALLGRQVDVISDKRRSNPYLWASIDRDREVIHDGARRQDQVVRRAASGN